MQNLLIVDNNISYIQNLISNISQTITNIKLYNFYINQDDKIYNDIESNFANIIIFNIDTLKIDFLEFIYQNNLEYLKKSIIILYNNKKQLHNLLVKKYHKYIFRCVKKSNNIDNLLKILRSLTYIKENTYNKLILEIKVKQILNKMGFNENHDGTKYIIESVEFLCKNNIEKFKLTDVYYYLSQK